MKEITLITDGACIPNPGPGGWSFILKYGEHSMENAGGAADTTNNRMEVQAVIEGLKALREPCEVHLISDSQYVLNGLISRHKLRLNGWIRKRKGKTALIPNSDLWQELDALAETHTVRGEWVRGHSGHPDNERCNEMADAQAILNGGVPRWATLVS